MHAPFARAHLRTTDGYQPAIPPTARLYRRAAKYRVAVLLFARSCRQSACIFLAPLRAWRSARRRRYLIPLHLPPMHSSLAAHTPQLLIMLPQPSAAGPHSTA